MNPMKNYSKANFIVILLAVVSLLVVLPPSEIIAAETISVNAKNLDNTILVEFSNSPNNTSEIKTIKVWLGGDKLSNHSRPSLDGEEEHILMVNC